MPKGFLSLWGVESEQLNMGIAFKWPGHVPLHPALAHLFGGGFGVNESLVERSNSSVRISNFADHDLFGELFGNHSCHVERRSLESFAFLGVAVWKSNGNFLDRQLGKSFVLNLQEVVEELNTLL